MTTPTAFTAYSWDDEVHGAWVKGCGERFRSDGVNGLLDKGEAQVDWDDERARATFLAGIVADAAGLLEQARSAQSGCAPDSPVRDQIADAARLLGQLLRQDVERPDEGVRLKKGVSKDRIVSVLAIATLLAVAYGTRREEAEARHLAPGRLLRPPAELDAAHQDALPPRRHSLLQQGVALLRRLLLRGYLWACVWLRPTPGPDFRARLRRADPGGT